LRLQQCLRMLNTLRLNSALGKTSARQRLDAH
jgi:hypothetical protein